MRWSLVVFLLVGCGADDDDEDPPIDPGAYVAELDWEPCSLQTGGSDGRAECARVEVPLDWQDLEDETIELFIKRLVGTDGGGTQVWFLQGGPGGAGNAYENLADQFFNADPTLDLYMLDHRGTGRSTRLGCAAQEAASSPDGALITLAEWPACIDALDREWGTDRLAHFSTTAAATDLGWLIDTVSAESTSAQPVHVHGTSYGTRWAQRYLQIFPEQPTSVSMLGVVGPDFSFTNYDAAYEVVGEALMARCASDTFCSTRLPGDPLATLRAAMDDLAGTCPGAANAGLTREMLRRTFGAYLAFTWHDRALIPALAYRLQRCSAADIAALGNFAASYSDPLAGITGDPLFSLVINVHIGLSELWSGGGTAAEHEAEVAGHLFSFGSSTRFAIAETWPSYALDQHAGLIPQTAVPVLMHEGELDPASPLAGADEVGAALSGPNQHYVVIADGTHSYASPTSEGYECAINQLFNFIAAPTAPLLDCNNIVVPLDFRGDASLAARLGTTDIWD